MLPGVILVASKMLRYMFSLGQMEIVNEVLDLFRFVFDKYSSFDVMVDNQTSAV
jgi:hypothetical protein